MVMGVAERIGEERKRLRLSQAAFAEAVGVSLSSQKRYEKGEREPDTSYLRELGRFGVDVGYVLAGVRSDVFGPTAMVEHDTLNAFAFALNVDLEDVESVVRAVQAYQQGRPAENTHLMIDEILARSPRVLDVDSLAKVLEAVERALSLSQTVLDPEKKARLVALVYRVLKKSGELDTTMIDEAISIAR